MATWPEDVHHISGIIVDAIVLLGAIAAAVKFRIFNVFGYRWRTELTCSHCELPDGATIFVADYVIHNTGQRPLKVSSVKIRVTSAKQEGLLLVPDQSKLIAERVMRAGDPTLKGIFQIEPGERTIFTLRAKLPHLDEVVFADCDFSTLALRTPSMFRGLYIKCQTKQIARSTEPVKSPATVNDDSQDVIAG